MKMEGIVKASIAALKKSKISYEEMKDSSISNWILGIITESDDIIESYFSAILFGIALGYDYARQEESN